MKKILIISVMICCAFAINASATVVINEFMADNTSTVADQDGEYDDWIELYNTGDTEISLDGYYLTDDSEDLTQWALPDVSVQAGEYLIIWADSDEEQGDLHAGFKLSASGESIFLVDSSLEVADEVDFGEQTSDISTGRYPDGTGSFTTMTPTFSAANQDGSDVEETEDTQRPEGWTEETHKDTGNANYDVVFAQDKVMRIDLTIDPDDWQDMLDDMTDIYGEFGSGGSMGPGGDMGGEMPDDGFPGGISDGQTQNGGFPGGISNGQTQNGGFPGGVSNGQTQNGGFPGGVSNGQTQNGGFPIGVSNGQTRSSGFPGGISNGQTQTGGFPGGTPGGEIPGGTPGGEIPDGGFPGDGPADGQTPGGMMGSDTNPIWKPCTFEFEDNTWYYAGVRFKGNSSLSSAWRSGTWKLPLRFDFDEFEDDYPEIDDQRFYGFKKLSMSSGFSDNTLIREKVTADIFREAGVPAPQTAFYRVYIDYGEGPVYFGLYTMVEIPDEPMFGEQFSETDGNLYKPDGTGATFAAYDEETLDKKTNEDEADYSDVLALYNALHSSRDDSAAWRDGLDAALDTDGFLRWLAVNTLVQNWDTYGLMSHNYYIYTDPGDGLIHWIPWDNNMALNDTVGMEHPLSLYLTSQEVNDTWPLIRYLADDDVYWAKYVSYVRETVEGVFEPEKMKDQYQQAHDLIRPYVVGDQGENEGYTYLTDSEDFDTELEYLFTHVEGRSDAASEFLQDNLRLSRFKWQNAD
ncbi:MAG: hypothetical protein GY749_16090 [Desulfobacteraceae bacterium]|nr:hypothetical protein [Desulfobacteraceae bacterium]